MLQLRPYQREAITAVTAAEIAGCRRPLIVLPTGAGKTVVFSHLIRERAHLGRALVLAHREELIQQAYDKIRTVAPDLAVGIVMADRDEHPERDVIVASVQTLARERRRKPLIGTISTIVVDEAHHAAAKSYRDVLRDLGSYEPDGPLTVGVTATAGRRDRVALGSVWEDIAYQRGILAMIADDYLCDVRALQVNAQIDYSAVKSYRGDFSDGSLGTAMEDGDAIEAAACAYVKYAKERPGIAFTPTIATAKLLAEMLCHKGIRAAHVSGETPRDERRRILADLHEGRLQVVCNAMVLTEGFDEPRISCILMARPTRSETLFTQMAGRGLRLHPGKTDCLLLTMAAPPETGLATIATLAGQDPEKEPTVARDGETLTEAVERCALERQAFGQQRIAVPLTAKQVRLFAASSVRWVAAGEGFALSAGGALLIVRRDESDLDSWSAIIAPTEGNPRVVHTGLSLEYAQGAAEEWARGQKAVLASATAPWRTKAPSAAQLRTLSKLHITATPMTAGDASDLITACHATRALTRLDTEAVLV